MGSPALSTRSGDYFLRANVLVAVMGVMPIGVKVPSAISGSRMARFQRSRPVRVKVIRIVLVAAAEKVSRPDAMVTGLV